ncbi:PAS domain S-box protein [Rhodoferax ferrireducens]|uniref:PAS domain S-box protein n=1 Tax=Rhodoferax ferrireducens TaxID=192843 RepID=UPI000E0D5AB6|nr:PAS domain S-box protein [Rhodoferax ferrireducens]
MPLVSLSSQSSYTRLLNRFYGIFFLVCTVFLTIGVPFVFYRKTVSAVIAMSMMLAVWLAWRMSRRGQPQKSLLYFAGGLWVLLVGLIFTGLPPYSAATALAMAVMLAVVIHVRAGVFFGVAYLLAWLLYVVLQSAQLVPVPYFVGNPLTGWFIGAVAFWLVLLPIPGLVRSLRRAASLQRAVIEAATDGILVVNNDGKMETYNQRFVDLWRIPAEYLNPYQDSGLVAYVAQQLVDPEQFLQKVRELYAHPERSSFDTLRFKDGRVFERHSQPQCLDEQIVGRVWSFRDVSERERTQAALRHGKEQFEAILNATSESIFLADRNGVLLAINATAAHRMNSEPGQLLGQCVFDKFPPGVAATRRASLAEVFATGQGQYTQDMRANRAFALNYYPVAGPDGAIASVAVFAADITERQQAEQAAVALVQRNQLLMQTATEGIHVLDSTGRLIEANGAFVRMLGYTAQELENANAAQWNVIWGEDELRQKINELIQHGGAFETVHRRKDGTLLDVEVHASGVCIEGQNYLYAASRDISQRKRNEAQRVAREARLTSLMASMQDTVVVLDAQGRVLEYFVPKDNSSHPPFCSSDGQIVGKTCQDLLPAAAGQLFAAAIAALLVDDQAQTFDYAAVDGGQAYHFVVTMSHIHGASQAAEGFFTVVRDNTLRRNARRDIERLAQRNKLLLNSVGEGIFDVDAAGRTTFTNPAALAMLGLTEADILGQYPHALFHHHHEDGSPYPHRQCPIHAVLRDGQHRRLEAEWFWRQDGTGFAVSMTVTPIVEDGQRVGAVVVFQDITERKRAQAEIHRLAFHDALTQLPNRRLLNDRLVQSMAACTRSAQHGALLFLDLDNFKPLNDAHGHDVGDMLLQDVARRLTQCVRQVDTVARFGGDEFVVVLGELDAGLDAARLQATLVAAKIRHALEQPYDLTVAHDDGPDTHVQHRCTSSIGISMFPEQANTADDILKRADTAMYQAKACGRNAVRFHDPASA